MLTQMFHSSPALLKTTTLYKNEGEQIESEQISGSKEVEVDALSLGAHMSLSLLCSYLPSP